MTGVPSPTLQICIAQHTVMTKDQGLKQISSIAKKSDALGCSTCGAMAQSSFPRALLDSPKSDVVNVSACRSTATIPWPPVSSSLPQAPGILRPSTEEYGENPSNRSAVQANQITAFYCGSAYQDAIPKTPHYGPSDASGPRNDICAILLYCTQNPIHPV